MAQNENLRTVARGLQLVFAGLIVVVLTTIVGNVLAIPIQAELWRSQHPVHGEMDLYKIGLVIFGMGVPISGLLDIIGKFHCLAVPEKGHVTGMIAGSLACTVAGYLFNLKGIWIGGGVVDLSWGCLLTVAGYILFLIFLRRLAQLIGSPRLAGLARIGLLATIAVGLLEFIGFIVMNRFRVGYLFDVSLIIAFLLIWIMYAPLIFSLRRATLQFVQSQTLV